MLLTIYLMGKLNEIIMQIPDTMTANSFSLGGQTLLERNNCVAINLLVHLHSPPPKKKIK